MKTRSILLCAVVGAVALIAYQLISQALVPWHDLAKPVAATAMKGARSAPDVASDGVYFNAYGVFMGAALSARVPDQSMLVGPTLARQLGLNFVVAFLLCLLAARLKFRQPLSVAAGSALAGVVVGVLLSVANADWSGFTIQYAVAETIDTAVGLFVTGLAVGLLSSRRARDERTGFSAAAPLAGVSAA